MAAQLPPELLALILTLACRGQAALARREIRSQFGLVYRAWHACFSRWEDVAAVEAGELGRVVAGLVRASKRSTARDGAGLSRVRSVYVKLTAGGDWRTRDSRQAGQLNKLLKLAADMQALELEVSPNVLSSTAWPCADLQAVAPRALNRLTQLRSLSLVGSQGPARLTLDTSELRE